jgi:hypothetical protein
MSNDEKWTMPKWMKPYMPLISYYGEEYITEMVNDMTPIQVNAPRVLIAVEIRGCVQMITKLHDKGLLKPMGEI